jgi:hypothetical protein
LTNTPVQVSSDQHPTIQEALDSLGGESGIVEIADSGRYVLPNGLNIRTNANARIELRAAQGKRPTLVLGNSITVTGGAGGAVFLNGLLASYAPPPGNPPLPAALVHVPEGGANQLGSLALTHCTLVPGLSLTGSGEPIYRDQPTLLATLPGVKIVVSKSIVGVLWINGQASVEASDSIVDATDTSGSAYVSLYDPAAHMLQPGGALTLNACTVIGKVYATLLGLVSDSIIWAWLSDAERAASPCLWQAPLWAARRQEGCVRFSYLPAGSVTGQQFHCVSPSLGTPGPLFGSLRYSTPRYGKVLPSTDDAIRRGASDGSEMGAFHVLQSPLRETNLRVRLQEFLPVGLEYGVFYET